MAVLVLSFWFTLEAIDHWPQSEPSDFDVAMAAEGFTMADAIIGSIDVVQRDSTGRLQLSGWAFDKELDQPVSVRMLIGSKFEPIAETSGARPDVTLALKQPAELTKNVVFTGRTEQAVDCGPYTIVGVNHRKHLSIISSDLVVPRCGN